MNTPTPADLAATLSELISEAIAWNREEMDENEPIDYADCAEFFARWRLRAREALKGEPVAETLTYDADTCEISDANGLRVASDVLPADAARFMGRAARFGPVLWVATVETRHWSFEAFGTTEDEARETLASLIDRHCADFPFADREYLADKMAHADLRTVQAGCGYRDGDCITRPL